MAMHNSTVGLLVAIMIPCTPLIYKNRQEHDLLFCYFDCCVPLCHPCNARRALKELMLILALGVTFSHSISFDLKKSFVCRYMR